MNKKSFLMFLALFAFILIVGVIRVLSGDEDTWLCTKEGWVKHGAPSKPMPTAECLIASPSALPKTSK